MNKIKDHYKLMKRNRGTAIILSLVIVSVLFILTSFLVRKVLTNTTMVEKSQEEQKSYALAKQGILYVLDRLNNSDKAEAWPGNKNWLEIDLDNKDDDNDVTTGDKECRVRVDKDDLPPDIFLSGSDPNNDDGYITIESQDLPKKLISLQGITDYTSPLLKYIRFINSDTTFEDINPAPSDRDMFGESGSGAICQEEAPFYILGELTWADGSSNNLVLTRDKNKAIVCDKINPFDEATTRLEINGNLSDADHHYYTDPSDPTLFDTAEGHYFDLEHLPSSYDYSSGNPTFYYGILPSLLWPEINEERYKNLADLVILASDCGKRGTATPWDDWYPSDDTYTGSYASGYYWRQEESGYSYNYTPPGVHLILSATQDLDRSISGSQNLLRINDSSATDTPAEYENIAAGSSFSGDVIFTGKDIRLNGVLPRSLSIASGGNIYVEGNIYTNGHSLALLANENVLLNTTHRWVAGYEGGDIWNDNGTSAANLVGVTDGQVARAEIRTEEGRKRQILNFGGAASPQIVTTDRIILRGCAYLVGQDNELDFTVHIDLGGGYWRQLSISSGPSFPIEADEDEPVSGSNITMVLKTPSAPLSFSRIRLTAIGEEVEESPWVWIEVDAIEIPVRGMDNSVIFAENGSWYVIPGDGSSGDNNQPVEFPLTVSAALSQEKLEEMSKWNDGSGGEGDWDQITYVYDSDLLTSPPPALPPSVNLVSLKRK
jgi:hypothetical protein